ncbi:GNAT superfamily N-acetyltransferase [Granulicella aggregans]|uniref:GNAT superfamily N-acetyltransferase n=1 Tax=Granulicella aggregans TaxID=474949 RepID=A0A7W7ZAK4_9BACT|nr:GNAT family N-acetyltransferase [Granulicella aggregans]MBB5056202.1 GNAT superfamily N-acetyltransferase [Granulicella aggregans]
MQQLPEPLFLNFVLTALQTTHARLAITSGEATRYPAAVAPFAAIATPTTKALSHLRELLTPDEYVWATALGEADPAAAQLKVETSIDVLQMILPPEVELPPPYPGILPLDCSRAAEMVALTDIAFPGFFRRRTCEMGSYFGIHSGETNELIAMGGERLVFPGYSEMSGLCTHPDHRGQGYAAHLLWHLARLHRAQGIVSWLHVTATNATAVNLYLKLGFQTVRSIKLHKLVVV